MRVVPFSLWEKVAAGRMRDSLPNLPPLTLALSLRERGL